ncbi:MAG TPA: oligopeptide/dipeptide ABC transporter ATP-binding protein, partial [Pirellulales bacterium]|nr:oligopeptide/dipeptide ABC transporter ATP-binding protein [Pirellulales bacterium]
LLITHDLGVVAEMADDVVVMYAGRVVEKAPVGDLFGKPLHPYTRGLFASLPRVDREDDRLQAIEGNVPPPTQFPAGCRFRERCSLAAEKCHQDPPLVELEPGHFSACWFSREIAAGELTEPSAAVKAAP